MDELTLVREFRAGIGVSDDPARAHARARLRAQMAQENGAPSRPIVGSSVASLARWRRARARGLGLSVAAAGVAAAAVVGIVATVGPDSRFGAEPAAAQALMAGARVARAEPDHPLVQGRYYYVRTKSAALNTTVSGGRAYSTMASSTRELWFALDGSGRIREVTSEPRLVGPRDRAIWRSLGSPPLHTGDRIDDDSFGAGGLASGRVAEADLARLASLPMDPAALLEAIRREVAHKGKPEDVDGLAFQEIGSLLANPAARPAFRAALFEAAALIDGVSLLGQTSDRASRAGTALTLESSYGGLNSRYILVFDPATSDLLQMETVLLESVEWADVEPPAVISYTVYLSEGFVGSTSEEPLD